MCYIRISVFLLLILSIPPITAKDTEKFLGYWEPVPNEISYEHLVYMCNKKNRAMLIRRTEPYQLKNLEQLWDSITRVICANGEKINLQALNDVTHLPFFYDGYERVPGYRYIEFKRTRALVKKRDVLRAIAIPSREVANISIEQNEIGSDRIKVRVYAEDSDNYYFRFIWDKWYWVGYAYGDAD